MAICNGRGDNGDHCCYIDGKVCEFLVRVVGQPRCALWPRGARLFELPEWLSAPVGRLFAKTYPGHDCKDWPQGIPELADQDTGKCCWNKVAT